MQSLERRRVFVQMLAIRAFVGCFVDVIFLISFGFLINCLIFFAEFVSMNFVGDPCDVRVGVIQCGGTDAHFSGGQNCWIVQARLTGRTNGGDVRPL